MSTLTLPYLVMKNRILDRFTWTQCTSVWAAAACKWPSRLSPLTMLGSSTTCFSHGPQSWQFSLQLHPFTKANFLTSIFDGQSSHNLWTAGLPRSVIPQTLRSTYPKADIAPLITIYQTTSMWNQSTSTTSSIEWIPNMYSFSSPKVSTRDLPFM